MTIAHQADDRICVAKCTLPDAECACLRQIQSDLIGRQVSLGADFQAAIYENLVEVYET